MLIGPKHHILVKTKPKSICDFKRKQVCIAHTTLVTEDIVNILHYFFTDINIYFLKILKYNFIFINIMMNVKMSLHEK